jgi:hypothetical protein
MTLKNYRFLGDEAEVLGKRLDAARQSLTNSTLPWSIRYWTQVVDQLLFQWQQLTILHDGDAQMSLIPRWTVDYEFVEQQLEGGLYGGISDRLYENVFRKSANLDASWEAHRAQRLAKAQY